MELKESRKKNILQEREYPVQIRVDSDPEDILPSSVKKKKSKKLMNIQDYPDQESVKQTAQTIVEIEKYIQSYHYSIPVYEIDNINNEEELRQYVETYDAGKNLNSIHLFRVFHKDLQHGGRYYGKYHCYIPKKYRNNILINGQETIQLDFKSAYPSILYVLSGNILSKNQDLYHIESLLGEVPRKFIKRIYVIILNAKDKRNAYQSIRSEYYKNKDNYDHFMKGKMTDSVIDSWVSKILAQYTFFKKYIFDPKSSDLAVNYESAIITEVYKQSMQIKIPVVDIYDCILCRKKDKKIMISIMNEACLKILGQQLNIDVES